MAWKEVRPSTSVDSMDTPRTLREVIAAALANRCLTFAPFVLSSGVCITDCGPGIVELIPAAPAADADATIISAGIHGNETAPLELVLQLAEAIDAGQVIVGAPTLLIIGHPAAIVAGTRYIDTNLNRLFTRDGPPGDGLEYARANLLMKAVDGFLREHGVMEQDSWDSMPLHLDLHTAIRESRYPRFVVEPFAEVITPPAVWRALSAAGMQAVLSQHVPSPTFSHYSRAVHGVVAFTLELGRVAAFGHNDLDSLAPMAQWMAARIEGRAPREASPAAMAWFRATHELRRIGQDFALGFDDDVPNFTEFETGALIASDDEAGETRVEGGPVAVVFPNAKVERGARAALLVRPLDLSGKDPRHLIRAH